MPKKTAGMMNTLLEVWRSIEAEGPSQWWKNERQKPSKGSKLNQ